MYGSDAPPPNGELRSCASVPATIDAYHVGKMKSKRGDMLPCAHICAMDPKSNNAHTCAPDPKELNCLAFSYIERQGTFCLGHLGTFWQ